MSSCELNLGDLCMHTKILILEVSVFACLDICPHFRVFAIWSSVIVSEYTVLTQFSDLLLYGLFTITAQHKSS